MRVTFTSNADQLRLRTQQRLKDILPAIRKAEEETGEKMKARVKYLSVGYLSTADLRQLGNPYRIGGSPPADPGIINKQTGVFYNSWHYKTELTTKETRLTIYNDAPYAKYMVGTQKMIARPILEKMTKTEGPARFQRLQAAFGAAISRK